MYAEWSSLCCVERWRHFWILWCFTKKRTPVCSPEFGVNRETVLNINVCRRRRSNPAGCSKRPFKWLKTCTAALQEVQIPGANQGFTLVLPEIQELASAAPSNDWKSSERGTLWRHRSTHTEKGWRTPTASHMEKKWRGVRVKAYFNDVLPNGDEVTEPYSDVHTCSRRNDRNLRQCP